MRYEINSNELSVGINAFGAEVSSIKNKSGVEYIWQAKPDIWPRHAPVLFPIVGKLKNNLYRFKGGEYSLGQHGFARDLEFRLINQTTDFCEFELTSDEETKKKYPFDFSFRLSYKVKGTKLVTAYRVINPSKEPLFFSVGGHPAFNCPLLPGEKFEDYYLEFENDLLHQTDMLDGMRLETKKELKPENRKMILSSDLFGNDALVLENNQINQIHLGSNASGRIVSMECEGWPYFGIWTKKDCREFICLEPWFGITDAHGSNQELSEKQGIIQVEAGAEFNCEFSVSIP